MLDALLTALLPSAATAAAVLALTGRLAPRRGIAVGCVLGLTAGFLVGNYFRGATDFRFEEPWERLCWLGGLALGVGLLTRPRQLPRPLAVVARGLFAGLASWQLGVPLLALVVLGTWVVLDGVARRHPGVWLPAGLGGVYLAAALVLAYAHSARLADLALFVGGALLGLALVARRRSLDGAVPGVALTLPGLLLLGRQYTSSEVPDGAFVLVGLGPLALATLLFPWTARSRAGWPIVLGFTLLLLPAGTGVVLAMRAESLYLGARFINGVPLLTGPNRVKVCFIEREPPEPSFQSEPGMRFILRWTAALMVPAILLLGEPVGAQNKDKDKDKDKDKEKPVTTEKMIKMGVLVGRVSAVYEDKRTIRLQVMIQLARLNPGSLQQLQQAQLDLARARARGDRNGMLSAQRSILQAQSGLYSLENHTQDVELQALDDAVVRTARPRGEFDEKGKLKKLTAKQLKEMKGPDPKLPGYKAEFGDIATEQILQVTLVRKKQVGPAPKPKAVPKKMKGKKKEEDDEAPVDVLADNLPQVSQVVILIDPPPAPGG